MQAIKKILILFFILFFSKNLFSHPHLFIKPSIKVVANNDIIKEIKISWEWDKWWSNDVITECDKDNDGEFNLKEIELVYKDFFIGIKDFGFFTLLYLDDKKININNVNNFNAFINDKIVTYKFAIPVNISVINNKTNFKIIFNDKTIYTAFDEKINILEDYNSNYVNIKVENYSYYGRQIIFDYITQ